MRRAKARSGPKKHLRNQKSDKKELRSASEPPSKSELKFDPRRPMNTR